MKNTAVIAANNQSVVAKPNAFSEPIYPTRGMRTLMIIMLELKNEVDAPISSGLNVVFAICIPRVHAIPSGIAAMRNARTKNAIETELSARNIAETNAILTAKTM